MRPLLYFEPKVGRGFAFCPRSGGIFELMPDEYDVLVSRKPIGEYKTLLSEMRSYSGPRRTVSDFLGHLTGVGILNNRLSYPVKVVFELTRACNLRCSHCFFSAGEPLPNELSTAEWLDLVRSISSYAVEVVLTGGEPFLRPDILDIVAEIKKHGLALRILSNGILLPRFAHALKDLLNPLTDSIQVSIDGTKEIHDRIRGEGSFDMAVEGIRASVALGIPTDISFTVLPENRASAISLYHFVASLGVRSFELGWGFEYGRLDRTVSFESYLEILATLREESKRVGVPVVSESFSELPVTPESVYTCAAGVSMLVITPQGDVIPCSFLRSFVFGNVRSEDLLSIWRKPDWEKLKRNLSGTKCASCPLFKSCRGGCPARAYYVSGDINRPGPDCRWSGAEP